MFTNIPRTQKFVKRSLKNFEKVLFFIHIFYFLNKYGYIQQDISNIIGLKERSTVVSGLKTINGFLDIKDEFFTDNIKLIESKL